MKRLFTFLLVFLSVKAIEAQSLPPIFDATPKALLKSHVLAAYPKNTWLENLVNAPEGAIYVTDYPEGKIFKVTLKGAKSDFAKIPGKIAGIANFTDGSFLVTGWDTTGKAAIFRVSHTGTVTKLLNIEGGMFPNGILHFYGDEYLIADSYAGCIWLYKAKANKVSAWLQDDLLQRSSQKSEFPAANGLKIFKQALYVSNTEKQLVVKIPINAHRPGKPSVYADKVNVDDFAFDDAGNIYAATNVYNSVIRISTKRAVTIVGDASTGVAGSTAILFAKKKTGEKMLYVSTSGGMAVPPPSGVEEGKIVVLTIK